MVTPVSGMVWIRPGSFAMGSPSNELGRSGGSISAESPLTTVSITRGIWMGSRELTQGEWIALMTNNPSAHTGDTNRPVEMVSWNNCTDYCARLTIREQASGHIPANWTYRLPTEAEWEYAARAGTQTRFYFGDDPTGYAIATNYIWYATNSVATTQRVGLKIPNQWGLFDMLGNVWEWCSDWQVGISSGPLPGGAVINPQGATNGTFKILRGGSYVNPVETERCAVRGADYPTSAGNNYGFRLVLAPL